MYMYKNKRNNSVSNSNVIYIDLLTFNIFLVLKVELYLICQVLGRYVLDNLNYFLRYLITTKFLYDFSFAR